MKILDTYWFSQGGIVRVEDEYEGIKYYIKGVPEMTIEEHDAQQIASWGNTFPKEAGDMLFGVWSDDVREGRAIPIPANTDQAKGMILVAENYLKQHTDLYEHVLEVRKTVES
jgi:hypothetical protein